MNADCTRGVLREDLKGIVECGDMGVARKSNTMSVIRSRLLENMMDMS